MTVLTTPRTADPLFDQTAPELAALELAASELAAPEKVLGERPSLDIAWPFAAVLVAAGFLVLAVALLITAWGGASRQADPQQQMLWLNLGVLAVSLLGAGCAVWLLVGRRSVAARSRSVQLQLAVALGLGSLGSLGSTAPTRGSAVVGLVTAAGLTRQHTAACPLMQGRDAVPATGSLASCGVCGS